MIICFFYFIAFRGILQGFVRKIKNFFLKIHNLSAFSGRFVSFFRPKSFIAGGAGSKFAP